MTPEEVLAKPCKHMPDDAVLQGIVVLYQWYRPGESEPEERGPWLGLNRDNELGVWNHLGMVESAAGDFRAMLLAAERSD